MSKEEASDLSALDSLFSKYGQGGARGLSEARKKEIYSGNPQEEKKEEHRTQKTLQGILDYQETIPDQEVDEFVTKIRDTRLLDDYPDDDNLSDATPAYNPWPLDEDTSTSTMADPLSGEIVVTDLQSRHEDDGTLDKSTDQENETGSVSSSDIDEQEAEDLSNEFETKGAEEDVSSDHHGDGDGKKDGDGEEDLFPRIDDDVDKDKSVNLEEVVEGEEEEGEEEEKEREEEEEEKEEEEKEEEEKKEEEKEEEENKEKKEEEEDEKDSSADTKDNSDLRTVTINVEDCCEETVDETDDLADLTVTDGKTQDSESNATRISEKSSQKKEKEGVPDFETFLAELGVDPQDTLDVEAQKSRARLSRVGPLAQRRPKTKRSSGGDEDNSKWMFVDSTVPRAQRSSIDEEEEEEVKTPVKAPQPASKPGMKRPPGGIGLGPMVLPGLGAALGGSRLKKTPTNTPNKTFQKSVQESKVTVSKSEPTRTTPLSALKKTPPPPASKAPPTTATKPLLNRPKAQAKPRPVSQVTPTKEPSQPAWLKELKSKPKPELKESKKVEEDKLNSDILHPKTPSQSTPKTPSWMTSDKTKKLPPISSSSTPKQDVESSTPSVPKWKQDLMKKKKAPPPPPPSSSKPPIKTQVLPKSPSKSPSKSPAKPVIARKPGFPKTEESTNKGTPKPSQPEHTKGKVDLKRDEESSSDKKREEDGSDETDSKKIKLSQSMDSTLDEDSMDVSLEVAPELTPKITSEVSMEVPAEGTLETTSDVVIPVLLQDAEKKDDLPGQDVEMKQEEGDEEEEVKVVKTEEKKMIIIPQKESESKQSRAEERKVTMETKIGVGKESVKEKQDEGKKGGISLEDKKDEKIVEKPVINTPKPKPEKQESKKVKPVKVNLKTDSKKEERKEDKPEEKKVTIVVKPESKTEETKDKNLEQKKVTIVTKPEDKNTDSGSMPKWKREARERMQKRKMSGGSIVPMRSPRDTTIETNSNNNTPQWKKDLVEKRKLFPRMPSLDTEEKGSVESQKSEKVLKRHTIAADVPTIDVPAGHKTGMPTWKQELEKKNARLAKHLATKDAGPEIKPPIEGVTQQPVPELS